MALLRNVQTQEFEDVPDSQAAAALTSGSHDLTEGKIEVEDPESGKITAIPTNMAAEMYDAGFKTPTRAAISQSEDTALTENRAGHFDDPLLAAGTGFLRGSTLGLSDAAIALAGKAQGVDLQGAEKTLGEVNPISTGVGTGVGAVTSSLATGGFGTANMARGIGEGLELAGAGKALTNVGQVAEGALQGASEGAILGAGQGLSDSIINKDKVGDAAEKIMMESLSGAKFGGFIGAGSGAFSAYGMPVVESAAAKGKELFEITAANMGRTLGKIGKAIIKDPEGAEGFAEAMSRPDVLRIAADMPKKQFEQEATKVAQEADAAFAPLKTYGKDVQQGLKEMGRDAEQELGAKVRDAGGDINMALDSINAKKDTLYGNYRTLASGLAEEPPSGNFANSVDEAMDTIRKLQQSGKSPEQKIAKELQEWVSYTVPDTKVLSLKGQDLKNALNAQLNGETEANAAKLLEEGIGKIRNPVYDQSRKQLIGDMASDNQKALSNLDKSASSFFENMPNQEVGQAYIDARNYNKIYKAVGRAVVDKEGAIKSALLKPEYLDSLNTLMDKVSDVAPQLKELASAGSGVVRKQKLIGVFKDLSKDSQMDPAILEPFIKEMGGDLAKLKNMKGLADLQKEFQASPTMTPQDKLMRVKSLLGQNTDAMVKDMATRQDQMSVLGKVAGGSSSNGGFNFGDWVVSRFLGAPGMAAYKGVSTLRNDPYTALQAASKIVNTYDKMSQVVARAGNSIADIAKGSTPVQIAVSTHRSESPEDIKKAKDTITLLNDPKSFQDVMGSKLAGLSSQPGVSLALNQQVSKTAQFLQSKLPVVPEAAIGGPTPQPSNYETAKFSRYLNAVEDPIGAVNRIAAGRGTPEEIETLKAVYPKTFSDLQSSVMNGIVSSGAELPYSKRIALSQMFDLSLDSTMNGDFVQKMQANLSTTPNGGAGRPQGSSDKIPRFKRRLDESVASDLQKITNGEYK